MSEDQGEFWNFGFRAVNEDQGELWDCDFGAVSDEGFPWDFEYTEEE
jgi:hypothetical protein